MTGIRELCFHLLLRPARSRILFKFMQVGLWQCGNAILLFSQNILLNVALWAVHCMTAGSPITWMRG